VALLDGVVEQGVPLFAVDLDEELADAGRGGIRGTCLRCHHVLAMLGMGSETPGAPPLS